MRQVSIPEFPNYILYEDGSLYSKPRQGSSGGWMTVIEDVYPYYMLRNRSKRKRGRIHQLLAQGFIPNPENKPLVLHKDDDKMNWKLDNLYWGDWSDNNYDSWNNTKVRKTYTVLTTQGSVITENINKWCRDNNVPIGSIHTWVKRGKIVDLDYIRRK